MDPPSAPPVVAIVGWKDSGKTTLLVALAAELGRRGRRIATLKHGHHEFEIDQPGRDSWRHLHEGHTEAVVIVSSTKIAMIMRTQEEEDPAELVRRLYAGRGYDLVLAEGFKRGPFPKIEVFRRGGDATPIHELDGASGTGWVAVVTDDEQVRPRCPVIPLSPDGAHVARLADLVERWLTAGRSENA